jgi:hypothetical protein
MPTTHPTFRPFSIIALLLGALFAATTSQSARAGDLQCPCLGDLNGDATVDAADLAILLGEWGRKGPFGDLSYDTAVDAEDLALLLGAWGPCPSIPVNDSCSTPISIGAVFVEVPFCTVGASTSLSAAAGCGPIGALQKDVFFRFVPATSGRYRVKVYDATFDARAAVYSAPTIESVCGGFGSPVVLGCTIDAVPAHIVPSVDGHWVEFDRGANQPIVVRVGSPTGAIGFGSLMIERVQAGWSPCDALEFWTGGGGGATSISTFEGTYPRFSTVGCFGGPNTLEIWHTFESACSQNFDLRVSTCEGFTFMDCIVSVYVGTCGELFEIDCVDDVCIGPDGVPGEEIILKDCTPNTKYFIRIRPAPGAKLGQFGLNFQVLTPCP